MGRSFSGFRSPCYTQVPDELFDELLSDLSGPEIKVLLYIIRRTFGFKRKTDRISKRQLEHGITRRDGTVLDRGTGLSRRAIRLAIDSLVGKNILLKRCGMNEDRGHETAEYALNIVGEDPWVFRTPPLGTANPIPGVQDTQALGYAGPTQETANQQTENLFKKKLCKKNHPQTNDAHNGRNIRRSPGSPPGRTVGDIGKAYIAMIREALDLPDSDRAAFIADRVRSLEERSEHGFAGREEVNGQSIGTVERS